MLISKFIAVPLVWLFTLLVCSLRPYNNPNLEYWQITDYTLFSAILYLAATLTINVILSRQLIYDYMHIHARKISFFTGIIFIVTIEIARLYSGYGIHAFPNIILFVVACFSGNLIFKRIYQPN